MTGRVRRGRMSLAAAFLLLMIGSLAPALIGSLAVPMTAELGLGDGTLGLAVAACWAAAAITSPVAGRLTDRVGWIVPALVGLTISAASLGLAGAVRPGRGQLILVMFAAGCGLALCSQSSNKALVAEISPSRLGRAFGIKQSATACAWLLAGLAAPLVAMQIGWRAAWVLAAVAAVPVIGVVESLARNRSSAGLRRPIASPGDDAPQVRSAGPRWPLIVGFALGTATISALSTFGAKTMVSTGLSTSAAGYVVAGAGALALAGRVLAGSWLDRGSPGMRPASILLAATTIGLILLAVPHSIVAVVGFCTGLAFGSAWPPVVLAAMVRLWPRRSGSATGLAGVGAALGSILGPLMFSAVASHGGYVGGWLTLSVMAALAATLLARPLGVGPHGPEPTESDTTDSVHHHQESECGPTSSTAPRRS